MVGICRLCASCRKDEQLQIIKDTNDSICHKLQKCCNVFIRNDDLLPKCVCQDCVKALEQAFEFYNRVHDAQEALTVTFLATTKMQNDNTAGKSNPTQTKTFVQDLQTVTNETVEYANVASAEREHVNVKEENFCDYQLQNTTATSYEDSFAIEQDYKIQVSENLLMENAIDERSQSIDNIMDDFRKRNILRAWEPSLTTDNNDGFENTNTPPKRFKETNCNSTEVQNEYEESNFLRTVLTELKNVRKKIETQDKDFKKTLQRLNEEISSLKQELRQLLNSNHLLITEDNKLQGLPFNTMSDLSNFEMELSKNNDLVLRFRQSILRIGGEDIPGFLRSALKKLFTDELATQLTWKGTKEKPSAEKYFAVALIKDLCHQRFPNADDQKINGVMQQHFVHAKDRVQKRLKK